MENLGYVPLKEAAKRSGKPLELLTKQCLNGRIRGAIKQDDTWYVPLQEVVVNPGPVVDGALYALLTLTERQSGSLHVTLYLQGSVLTGRLISKNAYVDRLQEALKDIVTFGGELASQKTELQQEWETMLEDYFVNMRVPHDSDEPQIFHFAHLDNVIVQSGREYHSHHNELLRVRLSAIDGFALGTLEPGLATP